MRAERHGSGQDRFPSFMRRVGFALLAIACLLSASPPAHAQTFPNLSGTGTGTRTQSPPPSGFPATSSQALTLYQVSPGGNVTGMLTTYWPGTAYTWTAYASGTISGSTLALTWTIIPGTAVLPSGGVACGESLNLTLATIGGVTPAADPALTSPGRG